MEHWTDDAVFPAALLILDPWTGGASDGDRS